MSVSRNHPLLPRHTGQCELTLLHPLITSNAVAAMDRPAGAWDVKPSRHRLYKPSQNPSNATSAQPMGLRFLGSGFEANNTLNAAAEVMRNQLMILSRQAIHSYLDLLLLA